MVTSRRLVSWAVAEEMSGSFTDSCRSSSGLGISDPRFSIGEPATGWIVSVCLSFVASAEIDNVGIVNKLYNLYHLRCNELEMKNDIRTVLKP